MTRETIEEVLSEIARDELAWQGQLPEAELASALDSMQRLTLVVAVEDRFHICLDEDDEQRLRTVADLVALIEEKVIEADGVETQIERKTSDA